MRIINGNQSQYQRAPVVELANAPDFGDVTSVEGTHKLKIENGKWKMKGRFAPIDNNYGKCH